MSKWRVFWVPKPAPISPPRVPVLAGWTDLAEREESTGIRPGDPILPAPDYRIDELLKVWTQAVESDVDDSPVRALPTQPHPDRSR